MNKLFPIGQPDDDSRYTNNTRTAAELLAISERQVLQLARSGRLLFKYAGGK